MRLAFPVLKGTLPPGLTATVDTSIGAVVISGTPTTNGTYSFYLRLTDTSPCNVGAYCFVQTKLLTIPVG